MRVGIVTDDGKTVSAHFGMAKNYLVFEMDGGVVKGIELRPKPWHAHHGKEHAQGAANKEGDEHHGHGEMLSVVRDCEALVAGGMGRPMYDSILALGIKPYITNLRTAEEVAAAYLDGTLRDLAASGP